MTFADLRSTTLTRILSVATVGFAFGTALAGHAQTISSATKDPRIGSLIEILGKTRTPSSTAISPDGTTVAWAVRTREGSQIHLTEVANPNPDKEKIIGTGSNRN